ncbi:hypothetical protein BDB01DRAFT_786421 [Pilobolus umbonatus]|nr:hypothetical protein BDB01DRAFT_786421 [Pilobolus umbonatus]
MTVFCASVRDFVTNLLSTAINIAWLPISFWTCVFSFFSLIVFPRKRIVPQVVAITGASSGIGEGIAYAYARDMISLVLIARNLERLEKVARKCRELGSPDVKVIQLDISDTKNYVKFLEEKTVPYGIDLFIANAGISKVKGKLLLDQSEQILQTNLMGTLAGVNTVYQEMKKRGRPGQIAVVTSVLGFFNNPSFLAYAASKAALNSYCRDLRALGEDDNVIVNTIAPGFIRTPMSEGWKGFEKFFSLNADYFGEIVKNSLASDVPFISVPIHQCLVLAAASTLPPSAKQTLAHVMHKYIEPIIFRYHHRNDKKDD